jgi:TonB family protein
MKTPPLVTLCLLSLLLFSSTRVNAATPRGDVVTFSLSARERQLRISAVHDSEFATLQSFIHNSCEATQPPEALATPDPLLDEPDATAKITVSFIVGADGRVHSPLILESAGNSEDRTVLNVVRSWRYRPAMCNGVPTEAEAKIEFSSR